ncbi:hypothetical protein [Autumnicola psychrophila]|uniref:UDP-glycosyltransferase n=1 Tax=Autumnicola psychrophila TaxID=3075592 RepID=A0ABU3DT01_9FLAO|nr:hypothetical protein [Zunongwangia sp. F225]MDT0686841.1 hypothetical protein [Zunongwangia sp. F225]
MNKTLGLVITDGVGYRNFCLSEFLSEASVRFENVIIYSGLPVSVFESHNSNNIKVVELPVFVEPFGTWFWRKFKEVAHLQLHKKFFGINDNLEANKSSSNSNRGKATRLIYNLTRHFHSENFIGFLEKKQLTSLANHQVSRECLEFLKTDRPDFLFFTHQRPPYVVPMVFAANKLKIKTGSFIFSWDNLASKGRMAAPFDSFLVWSDLMKEELLYFYPRTSRHALRVVGTPQFEPYVMPEYQMEKSEFYQKHDLSSDKKTICYSCGDISTSRNDELYIEIIATAISEGTISEPVNLFVRTSPAEEPERFNFLKEKFPFIRWNYPDWFISRKDHPEPWSQRVPSESDLVDLRGILSYSDLSINMCSTMSLDFMLFDKPVINPVFGNEQNGLYNDQRFLKYAHYEKVVQSGAVAIAKNEEELLREINFSLKNPNARLKEQKELLKLQIGKQLKGTSQRIAKTLKEFSED